MEIVNMLGNNIWLKNFHAGKRCFIIGNGPSLKSQNLKLLEGEICIVSNRFFCHPDSNKIMPKYWILADPLFWEKPDIFLKPVLDAFSGTTNLTNLFVPTWGHDFYSKLNLGPYIKPHYFNYDSNVDISTTIDFSKSIPQYGQNVIAIALMLAFYLGCSSIYLLGCDHDFMKLSREEYLTQHINHFYKQDHNTVHERHLDWDQWQKAMSRMIYEYEQLNHYGITHGVKISNATFCGNLDVFPRIDFESLFSNDSEMIINSESVLLDLFQEAFNFIHVNNYISAIEAIDNALNINTHQIKRIEGLEFLKAHCFLKLGRFSEALCWAKQDLECNPDNRSNTMGLIKKLETISIRYLQSTD